MKVCTDPVHSGAVEPGAVADAKIVDEISSMAASIATIARQKNLLALNAAIKAARAVNRDGDSP